MKNEKILAIIPARGGSKGILRKNLVDIGGKPLVAHTIGHAQAARDIGRIVVSSDDDEILATAASYGAETSRRPDELSHDATLQEVDRLLIWTVQELEKAGGSFDIVLLLYPTAPLRDVPSVDKAVDMVSNQGYDSVLSVYHDTRYLWATEGDTIAPANYDPCNRMPRQKEVWNQWAENKAIYVMKRDLLMTSGCRLGGRMGYVEMEKWRSVDVDEHSDLLLARTLYQAMIADSGA